MATYEEAFEYYTTVRGCDPSWLKGLGEDIRVSYEELLESKEMFSSPTVKGILSTFSDRGEWKMYECMNCVSNCTTHDGNDMVAYTLDDLYRSNGTKENKNYVVYAIRWTGSYGNILAKVKIPHDASERVIKNRFEKMRKELEEKMA